MKERAADRASDSPALEALGRIGLVARGVLHLTVGLLALRLAFGDLGEEADSRGALQAVARQPMGRLLVALVAVGLAGYALWRLAEAALDPADASWFKRLGYAGRGLLYAGFSYIAVKLVQKGPGGAGGGDKSQDVTARVLGWPAGRVLVITAGIVLFAVGAWNGWRAVGRRFEKELKQYEMSDGERGVVRILGITGHLARMAAYFVVAGFLVRAALRFSPRDGVGLDASLHELAQRRPAGPVLLAVVALGLMSFGLFQISLARYRRMLERR